MKTPQDAIIASLKFSRMVTNMVLDGLSDANLMVRPVPSANHIAWQLGHLICTEHKFTGEMGGDVPALPDGFVESYTKETATSDDPAKFETKDTYMNLYNSIRSSTESLVARLSIEDLAKPGPESARSIAPTVGDALLLLASHEQMHVGQYSVVRRSLNMPVAF
jgi:DinB superfamily